MDKPDPPATANESKAGSKCDTVMTDAEKTSTFNVNAPSTTNERSQDTVNLTNPSQKPTSTANEIISICLETSSISSAATKHRIYQLPDKPIKTFQQEKRAETKV